MARIELSTINPFELKYEGEQKRNLSFVNSEEFSKSPIEAREILRTLMLMHIVAPEFPNIISTNFKIENKKLIDELYHFYGKRNPTIVSQKQLVETDSKTSDLESTNIQVDYANALSGGLDSAYRTAKLMSTGKSLIGVHLRNLNPKANYLEHRASVIQAKEWGIPFKTLILKNGSKNSGYKSMMTRDLLLGMAVLTSSYGNGIKEVQIEGDFVANKNGAEFSEYKGTWDMFNLELKKSGIEIQIKGVDAGDLETVRELIILEKELGINILDLIQNCFSAEFQKKLYCQKVAKNYTKYSTGKFRPLVWKLFEVQKNDSWKTLLF